MVRLDAGPLRATAPVITTALILGIATCWASSERPAIVSGTVTAAPLTLEPIVANDNRRSAGTLEASTLTVRLEAREGEWRPDGAQSPGLLVSAFAVAGQPLEVPAPLVRVIEGTKVHAYISNRLAGAIVVHGLYTRPAASPDASAPLVVPGETREVRFLAGRAGTYYYWAAPDAATTLDDRKGRDTQLSGAFIVDPRDDRPAADRVLVVTGWDNDLPLGDERRTFRYAINGRSWPQTERLEYRVGDVVRMRLVNASDGVHPMHLHGFYFNVDGRGDERAHALLPDGSPPRLVVTERMAIGSTFALTWKPTRPGNWLFHCHDTEHIVRGGPLDGAPPPEANAHRHVENHALEMMVGPVMGITVTGASAEAPEPAGNRRQLRLAVRVGTGGTDAEPAFGYALDNGSPASPVLSAVGPTILLKRGEPVSIAVVNELPDPTSVHWHGIELESYFDGVPGFAGQGKRIAPVIAPGATFEARFTPPRSGTFMYHSHVDELRQQQAGLTGALLVLDDPSAYDPEHDIVLVVTVPRKDADSAVVLLNGSSTPAPLQMRVGQRYRLRFINLHTFRPAMRMRLLEGTTLATWTGVAKDGMDLPAERRTEGPAEIQMGNGEAYDFEFAPAQGGAMHVDVTSAVGQLLVTMPITVR